VAALATVVDPARLVVGRDRFVRALGVLTAIACADFGLQAKGLIGPAGLVPADLSMGAIWALCATGALAALVAAAGRFSGPALLVAGVCYGALVSAGGVFMGYQWDILLVEALVLGACIAPWTARLTDGGPPPLAAVLAVWVLVARLELGSAIAKWASQDPTWRSLTALEFHFETQPLPTWIGALAHHLPAPLLLAACAAMFGIQAMAPVLLFVGPRARKVGVLAMALLQALILVTGNYTFFNWLTLALTLTCWDTAARHPPPVADLSRGQRFARACAQAVAVVLIVVGVLASVDRIAREPLPAPLDATVATFRTVHLANGYGLFASMTTERDEIELEATRDGVTWEPYVFPAKPGPLDRRPSFVAPHQPRLDWQMWFCALGSPRMSARWLAPLFQALLEARPEVLALFERAPLGHERPLAVRALRYRYHLAPLGAHDWWTRELVETYVEPITLR
jgi:hypothetical protein